MDRRLILVRHAKSDWGDADLDDHARPLNPRGRAAADRVGRWLAEEGLVPQEVLLSSALRTQETWARMAPHLPGAPDPRVIDALYHAGPDVMLRALQGARAPVVLMLGHNPGIGTFARWMLAQGPAHARFADYPTCATLVARFPAAHWADVTPASGTAEAFVIPRELPED